MPRSLFLLFVPLLAMSAASDADVRTEIAAFKEDVNALIALREAAAKALPGAGPAGQETGLLRLTATRAVAGSDLQIFFLRKEGTWTRGWATVPLWNALTSQMRPIRLDWKDDQIEGEVTIRLLHWFDRHRLRTHTPSPFLQPFGTYMTPWGTFDAPVVRCGVPIPVSVRLAVRSGKVAMTGTLRFADPSVAPLQVGEIPLTGSWLPAGVPVFAPFEKKKQDLNATMWDDALMVANQVQELYQQIRAIELQQRLGLPVAEGLSRVTRFPIAWADPNAAANPALGRAPNQGPIEKPEAGLDLGGDDEPPAKAPVNKTTKADRWLAGVRRMRAQAAAIMTIIKAPDAFAEAPVQRGDVDPRDPGFGPNDFCKPMATNAAHENLLPAPSDGPQQWPYLDVWKVIGPFPLPDIESWASHLPDLVPEYSSLLRVEQERFPFLHCSGCSYYGDGLSAWRTLEASPLTGAVVPPIYVKKDYSYNGMDYGAFHATTTLVASEAGEVWAALKFKDRAMIWVNDRLVWTSQDDDDDISSAQRLCRFRLPLRKGPNTVMVRCGCYQRPTWMALRVCARGRPKPEQQSKTEIINPRLGTLGLRGDGSCLFPQADPPVAWDLEKGINVRWRADIGEGTSGPVTIGSKVFTTAQPYDLVCVDGDSGKTLWRRFLDPDELYRPEVHAKVKALVEAFHALPPDSQDRPELLKKIRAIQPGFCFDAGYGGSMLPVPVTDGKHIWVKSGATGLGCFDPEGNRLWFVPIESKGGMGAEVTSPILAWNRLYLQIARYTKRKETAAGDDDDNPDKVEEHFIDHRNYRRYALACYDPASGKRAWITEGFETNHWGNRYDADGLSSPFPVRLVAGDLTLDVVVMPNSGTVLRAEDGVVLLADCGSRSAYALPLVTSRGDLVLLGTGGIQAIRLVPRSRDSIETQILYSLSLPPRTGALGGLVQAAGQFWVHDGNYLMGHDENTGRMLVSLGNIFRHASSESYMPPFVAGKALFVADTNRSEHNRFAVWKNGQLPADQQIKMIPGVMSAIAPGLHPLVLGRNAMDGVTNAPVAIGGRLYIRAHTALYCLERVGSEGARYEGERLIRTLLPQLPPRPPAQDQEVLVPSQPPGPIGQYGGADIEPGLLLSFWEFVGPINQDQAASAERALRFPVAPTFLGQSAITVAGREEPLRIASRGKEYAYPPQTTGYPLEDGPAYSLALIHAREGSVLAPSTVLWAARCNMHRAMTVRLSMPGDPGQVVLWIGGTEVRDGQRIRLDHGSHLLCMRTTITRTDGLRSVQPILWPAWDPQQEAKARNVMIEQARPWLERALAGVGDGPLAQQARAVLAER